MAFLTVILVLCNFKHAKVVSFKVNTLSFWIRVKTVTTLIEEHT